MRTVIGVIAIAVLLFLDLSAGAATRSRKKASSKKPAAGAAVKSSGKKPAAKSASSKRTRTSKSSRTTVSRSGKNTPVRRAATWRTRQAAPTPARYKEIQEALAAKGYLKPEEATGVWDQTSVAALKRFQMEQNIEASGKINSLSLIALGLGPKHDTAAAPSTPAPQDQAGASR